MTREQAQHVLLAYRLGEVVPDSSELAVALAMAADDPALASWLERELASDRALRSRLRSIAPPIGLRERIRAASRVVEIPWWRKPTTWAAAVGIVLAVGAAAWWSGAGSPRSTIARSGPANRPALDFPKFRTEMVRFVSRGEYRLDLDAPTFSEVQRFLSSRGSSAVKAAPEELIRLGTYGCQVFEWNGEKVTLICFQSPDLGMTHVLLVDVRALPDLPVTGRAFASIDSWSTAAWKNGDHAVLVCTPGRLDDLRRILGG